jgi:hypothetical protein
MSIETVNVTGWNNVALANFGFLLLASSQSVRPTSRKPDRDEIFVLVRNTLSPNALSILAEREIPFPQEPRI